MLPLVVVALPMTAGIVNLLGVQTELATPQFKSHLDHNKSIHLGKLVPSAFAMWEEQYLVALEDCRMDYWYQTGERAYFEPSQCLEVNNCMNPCIGFAVA